MKRFLSLCPLCLCGFILSAATANEKPFLGNPGPHSPRDEQATFRIIKGFRVELAACEPKVVDPVAMAFDENGRLFVAEMRGYPNDGVGTGKIKSGKIRLLEDRDGDGFFEKSTVFAEGLRFPTAVMPYRGGLLVANSPDLLYLEDTNGDGRADRRRVLYTGFDLGNIQQLQSGFQWGLDNWVYACAGGAGGTIKSIEKPDAPAVVLRGRGFRFHPDKPGSLEPTCSGGQYGLASDDWGRFFSATNSNHLRHFILFDQYLRRNPYLPVTAVTLDIPDHGAACKVHRISPFEAWRVERTTRRKGSATAKNFSPTELVPGGFITSACSPLVYRGGLFQDEFHGNTFVCDPANNLIHRDILQPNGATFIARRGEADCEFLASTDNWFRPVWIELGPDGAMYVADFYREVIETPLSLPDDIKKRTNLQSRGRGRIWRIVPSDAAKRPAVPALGKMKSSELVPLLADKNAWHRMTSQRLLVERQDKSVIAELRKLASQPPTPPGLVHALWTLEGLGALRDTEIETALKHEVAGVREHGLRLAERRLDSSEKLRAAATALAGDPDARVRFQLCLSLGESTDPLIVATLAQLATKPADSWTQTAWLSSAGKNAAALLDQLVKDREFMKAGGSSLLSRLSFMVGARGDEAEVAKVLNLLTIERSQSAQVAVLEGLGKGMQNGKRSVDDLWNQPNSSIKTALEKVSGHFDRAAREAKDDKLPLEERLSAVRLLAYAPPAMALEKLPPLLTPLEPQEIQLEAVRALSGKNQPAVADALLSSWSTFSPVVRREALEALFARADRLEKLLRAIEEKKIQAVQLEPARIAQLRKHPNPQLRERATKLLTGQVVPARQKVVEAYQSALDLKGDPQRGKLTFKKTCATCHRLENEGNEVGADLLAALRTKTPETLLVDILDPSREVDPRYIEYLVTTTSGKSITGLIAAETAASVTLRRAEKAEDVILRSQIESIQATAKSLMPEGLEMQLNRQDVADVIAYLMSVVQGKRQNP